jgi:hypothetical protein
VSFDAMHQSLLKAAAILDATLATSLDALDAQQLRHILWALSDYIDELRGHLDAEMGRSDTEKPVPRPNIYYGNSR